MDKAFNALRPHQNLYDEQLASLPQKVQGRFVNTSAGEVWLSEIGAIDKPPLLALHGLHTPTPFNLEMIWQLTEHFRVICPDLPGHAGRSRAIAPLPQDHLWGRWVLELMDQLNIRCCPMVGISFGGAVVLDTAALAPERVGAASLIVPGGLQHSVMRPLKNMLLPWLKFKIGVGDDPFSSLMKPLMAESWPTLEAYYAAVFSQQNPGMLVPPGPVEQSELARWTQPVQLVVAEHDAYFAPNKLKQQARRVIPNLQDLIELDDFHIPTAANRAIIQEKAVRFLTQN